MHFVFIDKGQSLRPEINEDEANKEQLSCIQNMDDIVDLSSSEKAEQRTDPILLSRYFSIPLLSWFISSTSY